MTIPKVIYEIANLVFEITRQVIVFQKNPDFVALRNSVGRSEVKW